MCILQQVQTCYELAANLYEKVLVCKPDDEDTLFNWGLILYEQASAVPYPLPYYDNTCLCRGA